MLVVALALTCLPVQGFLVNYKTPTTAVSGKIFDSFGSSHGSTTLRATWRKHFAEIQRDVPFHRVRFHGILDDDLSTYLDGQANGALVFDTLDWLVEQKIRPTVELGFMPEDLAWNSSLTNFHYKGGTSMYKNETAFRAFITGFVSLMVQRYGIEEVSNWRVEVWNEPNCGFGPTWVDNKGCGPDKGNQTAYFQLYKATAESVKAVDPRILVGGPATAQLAWIPEFLNFTSLNGVPCDFVTSHLYPTDPFLPQTRDSFMEAISVAASVAGSMGKPLFLTEFNAGLGPASLCHGYSLLDSSFAAVFSFHQHLLAQAVPNLVSMSWWTFTDFGFEEGGADPSPYLPGHTKFGAMTRTGVPKPVYRGFQMISQQALASGGSLPLSASPGSTASPRQYKNAQGVVIGAGEGTVDMLVTSSPGFLVALAGNFNASYLDIPKPSSVTLEIEGLPTPLPKEATLELIDDTHANPMAVWEALGSPLYPNTSEIAAELQASLLIPEPITVNPTPGKPSSVSLTFTLPPYAMARIVIVLAESG